MQYLYCIKGAFYWDLFKISVSTLNQVNSNAQITCIVDHNEYDKAGLDHINIYYITIDGSDPAFPKISYRNNCFVQLFKEQPHLYENLERIIVVDADVLWKLNPEYSLQSIGQDVWGQIVTPLHRFEYNPSVVLFRRNIGARTIKAARNAGVTFEKYSRFRLNGGLYMINWSNFKKVISDFVNTMRAVPVKKIKLSEALLSHCISERRLTMAVFESDVLLKIKFLRFKKNYTLKSFGSNLILNWLYNMGAGNFPVAIEKDGLHPTGREFAVHYMSDQKDDLIVMAKKLLNQKQWEKLGICL